MRTAAYFERLEEVRQVCRRRLPVDEEYYSPPIMSADAIERSGFPNLFPGLTGLVTADAQGARWGLPPAMCLPLFDHLASEVVNAPSTIAVEGYCFRNEGNEADEWRIPSYRISETVRFGNRDECRAWFHEAGYSLVSAFRDLGIDDVRLVPAVDSFMGSTSNALAVYQIHHRAKWELVSDGAPKVALASVNWHDNKFVKAFGLTSDSPDLTSACCGVGLDRVVRRLGTIR